MSETKQVDVRYSGHTYRLTIERNIATALITHISDEGLQAVCYPNGTADITKYDPRSHTKISEGLGSWHQPIQGDPNGTKIRIPYTVRITNVDTGRSRILAASITVFATFSDDEEFKYTFPYDSGTWKVNPEEVQEL